MFDYTNIYANALWQSISGAIEWWCIYQPSSGISVKDVFSAHIIPTTTIHINHFFLNIDRWKFMTNHFYALTCFHTNHTSRTHAGARAHSPTRAIAHALGLTVGVTELPPREGDTWWPLNLTYSGVNDDVNLNMVLTVIETPNRSLTTTIWGWLGVNLNEGTMIEGRSGKGSHAKQCF